MGIGDLYLSSLFQARKDGSHGYDVVEHVAIESEFGNLDSFVSMARKVRNRGMDILLDVVPNHMSINDPGNMLWRGVLENGRQSYHAKNFDIDVTGK